LAGCGDGEEDAILPPDPPDIEALVDYFPDDAYQMEAVDLVALRAELGLPGDADPTVYPKPVTDMTRAEMLFSAGALSSFPYARQAQAEFFDPGKAPLSIAIDHSQVKGAASAETSNGPITVIATDQPFEEVANALAERGWTEDGDVLESPEQRDTIRFAAPGEEGEIVLGMERALLDSAVNGETDGNSAGAMMGGASGSVRFAFADQENRGCVSAVAGGGDAARGKGTVLVDGGDDPDPAAFEAVTVEANERNVEFGEPEVLGNLLRVPFVDVAGTRGLGVDKAAAAVSGLVFEPCP
jgi:hypothetical protein